LHVIAANGLGEVDDAERELDRLMSLIPVIPRGPALLQHQAENGEPFFYQNAVALFSEPAHDDGAIAIAC
jgi:hypothetical protein